MQKVKEMELFLEWTIAKGVSATKVFTQKILRISVATLQSNATGRQIRCRHAGTR